MLKRVITCFSGIIAVVLLSSSVFATEIGGFGGVSEGRNLPRNMDQFVDNGLEPINVFNYTEMVFLSGEPVRFEGTLTVDVEVPDLNENPTGFYVETYTYVAEAPNGGFLNRVIAFNTSYRVIESEGVFRKKLATASTLVNWAENVTIAGTNYQLRPNNSYYHMTTMSDLRPGITYSEMLINYKADYIRDDDVIVVVSAVGTNNGFLQPWSKAESFQMNQTIQSDTGGTNPWQMSVRVRPYLHARKTINHSANGTNLTSMSGTYIQHFEREANIAYDILTGPSGSMSHAVSLDIPNNMELLPISDNLAFLDGHFAENDIKRMYSLGIFTEQERPFDGMQFQTINRGDYVKALCLAMNIDRARYEGDLVNPPIYYGDVPATHRNYKYIMAATDAKLVEGVGADFNATKPLTRQEAFVIFIRIIGLERLSYDNVATPFVDDAKIANWARKEIMAAYRLGLIRGDDRGNVNPLTHITKAEAAIIINRLIDFLREDLPSDYRFIY